MGLTVNASIENTGMFSCASSNATIKNLTLRDATITNREDNTAAVVGRAYGSTITGCSVVGGSITGNTDVGGIVGYAQDGATITACRVSGTELVANRLNIGTVGGIVGTLWRESTMEYCVAAPGMLTLTNPPSEITNRRAGTLAGVCDVGSSIDNCYWLDDNSQTGCDGPIGDDLRGQEPNKGCTAFTDPDQEPSISTNP